jgi:hypothetical protein
VRYSKSIDLKYKLRTFAAIGVRAAVSRGGKSRCRSRLLESLFACLSKYIRSAWLHPFRRDARHPTNRFDSLHGKKTT